MRPEFHLKRYKKERESINAISNIENEEIDLATITTTAHWASDHLISALIDSLDIPENLKHRNHRSVKKILKSDSFQSLMGDISNRIYKIYSIIESDYMSPYQYGRAYNEEILEEINELLDELYGIATKYIEGEG